MIIVTIIISNNKVKSSSRLFGISFIRSTGLGVPVLDYFCPKPGERRFDTLKSFRRNRRAKERTDYLFYPGQRVPTLTPILRSSRQSYRCRVPFVKLLIIESDKKSNHQGSKFL